MTGRRPAAFLTPAEIDGLALEIARRFRGMYSSDAVAVGNDRAAPKGAGEGGEE